MPAFELLTSRLRLRNFEEEDAVGFYDMNADPEVIRYTGDPPFVNVKAAKDFIRSYDHYKMHGYGRWSMERLSDEAYLGFCGLKYHPDTQEVDLGYRLIRKYWGHGYAGEAAFVCLKYAFEELQLSRVIGRTVQENTASCRILEKMGMKKVKKIKLADQSAYLYEITKGNFLAKFKNC